jgi:nucleoredoxin
LIAASAATKHWRISCFAEGVRRLLIFVVLVQSFTASPFAKLPPLSVKEVSLMLRSGYSVAAVQQELATRRLIEPIDAAAEASLLKAGASIAFIEALRRGAFSVPEVELAAAKQQLAEQARRKGLQDEEAKKLNAAYQAQLADARAAAAHGTGGGNRVAAQLKGDLVVSRDGSLGVFNDEALEKKKLIGLFFSAQWCSYCRKFTPELVQFYNRVAAAHPEFEIVFMSRDKSAPAMEKYMRELQMPWPAVKFEKLVEKETLRKYAGAGIPCLVVVDAEGKVVSDSYAGDKYVGPSKVLADLDKIFAAGPAQVALQR